MDSRNIKLILIDGERWWGGAVFDGTSMPYGKETFNRNLDPNETGNQSSPILISNKGRFIWSEDPFAFYFKDNFLTVKSKKGDIDFGEGHKNLQEVFKFVKDKYFAPKGLLPEELLFTAPQYNTWIELIYDQEQDKILEYAQAIIDNNMPTGVFMIDDNWQEDYGVWSFHPGRFSYPKLMVNKLHKLGFKVMLWICPFISADSVTYRELRDLNLLYMNGNKPHMVEWWNGYSAVLDLTNEKAVEWFDSQLQGLIKNYGIDGFKFDAGDPSFYTLPNQEGITTVQEDQCLAYAKIGTKYKLNEYRACWKMAGEPLVQRLQDKTHSWEKAGLASLIPNALAQGLMGYAFGCPDMIGGGEYLSFLANSSKLDQELFVRYAQCSALFPMMQFSAAPWRVLDEKHSGYCIEAANLHKEFGSYILEVAKQSAKTGEPILRHMAYAFPNNGYEEITSQFMLGENLLVAPVVQKGSYEKTIHFPEGTWQGDDGSIEIGSCTKTVAAPLSRLPWYRKIN
ncbi:glycoside hydrolase family 31 protein [Clostridium lacusfryxellense]|uniref:glycoside hydrolase family 31 protein n=1 Tax=Clostridium lacusfryxellense TaxID=205328 RepID=UPI001C0B3B23|nr:glycoside hydrolase family 31 protein [Clostridium lacusfryxellense]MBU3112058.1 glycoside hydrolase family 31 protein [Clostridium lacusfryxellense]